MGDGVVVKSRDVPERDGQIHLGLSVGRKECAAFSGMLVVVHVDVEGALNVLDRPRYMHVEAIGRAAADREAVRQRPIDHGIVVLLRGTKPLSELRHGEELPVRGAGGIVQLLQQ